jgi:hypothetical protein
MPLTRHLTFANIASALALTVALGTGTSYAAAHVKLPKNSVGAKQLQNNAVTGPKIADASIGGADLGAGAVTGNTVADGSLTGADLSPATVAQLSRPRAYGSVDGQGHLISGVGATVTPTGDGICVVPAAGTGINPATDALIATADDPGAAAVVTVLGSWGDAVTISGCSGGYFLHESEDTGTGFAVSPPRLAFVIP